MIIVTVGGNMSPDSGWWSHMTHSASKATNLHTYADTHTHRQTDTDTKTTTHVPSHLVILWSCLTYTG